jgi:hypothetical protein
MCHYLDQLYYFSKCKADRKRIQLNGNLDDYKKAKANGHYYSDASPARGKGGKVLVMWSSKRPGDCPQCPHELLQV